VARRRQRFAHRRAAGAVTRIVDVGLGDATDERAAPEEAPEMPLLVAERDDVDAGIAGRPVLSQRACGFERINDAERTIEPAGVVLAFEMRAREDLAALGAAPPEYIADAVDLGV